MVKWVQFIKKQKQIQDFSIYGFGQFFNLVTPLLVAPYVISICGEGNYGKIAVGMALSFFLIVFIDFGADISGVREVSVNRNNPQKLNEILISTYTLRLINLVFVLLVSTLLFLFIPYFNEESELFFLSLAIVIGQFFNPIWFLQGLENIKSITLINIVSKVIYVLAVFLGIKNEQDYIYVNLFWGLGMFMTNATMLIVIKKKYNHLNFNLSRQHLTSKFKEDFAIFSAQIFVSIQMYAPVFLLSSLGSNTMAGQFKIIEQITNVFKTYILLFFNYVFPKVCLSFQESTQKGFKVWGVFNGLNAFFVLILMAIIYIYSQKVVTYFNPENVNQIANLLRIGVLIPIVLAISNPLKQIILAKNMNKAYMLSITLIVVSSTLALLFVIPIYEVEGVLWVLIATELVFLLVLSGLVFHKFSSLDKLNPKSEN